MHQGTLPAGPRPPELTPLRPGQIALMERPLKGELDEVIAALPAFDRVPFATPGSVDHGFLDAIVRRAEPLVRPPDKRQ